jgi:hypothetical protein
MAAHPANANDAKPQPHAMKVPHQRAASLNTPGRYQLTPEQALAASLTTTQIAYLESCPLILTAPPSASLPHGLAIVHAGLVPGVTVEHQDPSALMSMRSIDLTTHVPSRDPPPSTANDRTRHPASVAWPKLWNMWQDMLPARERVMVVYGHDSARGMQRTKWTVGLDSGCWKGGRLSALVVKEGADGEVKMAMESVQCKDWRVRE